MDYPEYLYHYTSIETLALIMSKRCIRFNCLKFVDDPEENVSSDIKQSGKLCLVSCWTDMVEDSLPMWNMYTPKMRGVKLKMKSYPFKEYPATMKNAWNLLDSDGNIVEESGMISYLGDYTSYIDEQKIMKDVKLNSTEFYVLKQIEELRKPCKENIDEKIFLNNINVFDNVNTLINKGIIEHLSILLDTRLIGYNWYVIFVQLQENQIDNLIRYLEDSSINVTHVNYMISNNSKFNFSFEVHSLSNAELEVLIDQIQRKFNALITTKKIKIIKECKFSFLTHYVLDIIKTKYLLND